MKCKLMGPRALTAALVVAVAAELLVIALLLAAPDLGQLLHEARLWADDAVPLIWPALPSAAALADLGCPAPMALDDRVDYYLGSWANCSRDASCACATDVACHHAEWPPANRRFCAGSAAWTPSWRVWAAGKLRMPSGVANYAMDWWRGLRLAGEHVALPVYWGDGAPPDERGAPVVAKVRSLAASDATIIYKLESGRHFGRLGWLLRSDVVPFGEKRDALVWRGSGNTGRGDGRQREHLLRGIARGTWAEDPRLDLAVRRKGEGSEGLTMSDLLRYKMILMVEGNDLPSGLVWALLSTSVVVMPPSTCTHWAMSERLRPWEHFLPLQQDLADLGEKARWCLENLGACERIGRAGRCWAAQFADAAREAEVERRVVQRAARVFAGCPCRCP